MIITNFYVFLFIKQRDIENNKQRHIFFIL